MRCSRRLVVVMILALAFFRAGPLWSVEVPTHLGAGAPDQETAAYHIVNIYEYPGFKLIQFHLPALAQYSYLLVSNDQALVVDPGRDVSVYLDQAKKAGARIVGVFLTHNHADFVAGHMELARRADCPIFASAASGCTFRFQPLREGSAIEVGEAIVKILVTPGHTLEALCGLVAAKANPREPVLLFSGDTLWIGRMGRPDLVEGKTSAAALASLAYDTWTNKLRLLPDTMAVFPAHGGGALYGLRLSDEPTSTLGTEKKTDGSLKHRGRGEFIAALLANRPEVPRYFSHVAALNKRGPQLVAWEKPPAPAGISWNLMNSRQYYVVDVRRAEDFAAGHIPRAINIGLAGNLENWVGTLVPWNANLVLYGNSADLKEAATRLERVGYPVRVITPEAWDNSRIPLTKSDFLKPEDLKILLALKDSPVVVDVRPYVGCASQRLGEALSFPLEQLHVLAPGQLDPAQPVVTVGDSTYGASLAVGILERLGFKQVACLDGGAEDWAGAGLQVSGAEPPPAKQSSAPPPRRVPKKVVRLPQRISATDLKRSILDLPGAFELIDLRPPEAFAAYSLPGSVNVDVEDILQSPLYIKGSGPLILVDRDGSLAMAVGGALSQKTWRPIKVLHGGLEAYKKETEEKPQTEKSPASVSPESANTSTAGARAGAPWWKRLFQ